MRWIIENYPVFQAALQMPLSGVFQAALQMPLSGVPSGIANAAQRGVCSVAMLSIGNELNKVRET